MCIRNINKIKMSVYAIELAKTSDTKNILDLIWMKILNSDSQCVFRIILVEKLRFVRPNWNNLWEITYESKLIYLISCKL